MKHFFKYLCLASALLMMMGQVAAQNEKSKKVLLIGVDGIINTAIDYASTPGIDRLKANASYSMNGYGGVPAYSSSGWSTMLTGVSADKHGVTANKSFSGNNFMQYPSVVSRIKSAIPSIKMASVVRTPEVNTLLNQSADYTFQYASDEEVYNKSVELLNQTDMGAVFVQFSSPAEVGEDVGFQLRQAQYVLAIQKIDQYVAGLQAAIQSRAGYADEDWNIFLASTHGGTESGIPQSTTPEEFNVPVILSGAEMDKKELIGTALAPRENSDNILTINKASSGDKTYVRIPVNGTALQGMRKYTIEFWVKAGDNSSDPAIMGDKDWDSGGNPGFVICRSGSTWKINFANDKRTRYDIGSTKPLEDGNWHHLAITFDMTKQCNVYQDGELVAASALTYKDADNMLSPFNYICLAQEGTQGYGGGAPNWAGTFNEVRIWTDVLSAGTIRDYMYLRNIENSSHPNKASLNLYLKMDEVRGNIIKDYSGKGNDGELVGPASERHPYYPIGLTDVAVNVLSHFGIRADGSWGLEGSVLKSNVPFRLFKVPN
ncbi:LamG-like jellyroll fold domain-containing protein [Agriterribacter sp.]|uniref:LamG-like jellyroll fold domain-containing protein n=1 Tax=Agriterribacter sp. TaxID=2821509 RepID=UPI002D18B7D5|nr:LamG-like jellyroll fold domain-containing protein [Agriterribacter sp.]HRO46841.1 alkaline phosphatase family protein [Agriterribacter sp.]HRQ18054.1 alkaline phosphatase family protein [Agriterribacter sp.]